LSQTCRRIEKRYLLVLMSDIITSAVVLDTPEIEEMMVTARLKTGESGRDPRSECGDWGVHDAASVPTTVLHCVSRRFNLSLAPSLILARTSAFET
jgi:hypothetical protein